jgi:hypothetical protein
LIFVGKLKADFREFFELSASDELKSQKYSVDIVFQCRIVEVPKRFKKDLP